MLFRARERATQARHTAEIAALTKRLDGLNTWLVDAESLYEKSRTLHARLSKRDSRVSGLEPEPSVSQGAPTQMKPLALALLNQGRNGGLE